MLATIDSVRAMTRDLPRSISRIAQDHEVKRETEYYLARIGSVKSVDDFMADQRLYRYALTAFGLGDMIYAKAFIKKLLREGVDDRASFANQLVSPRFREFAEAFNFARYGGAATAFDRTQTGTSSRYLRVKLEERAGQTDEGVRLALYFMRNAPNIKSATKILADPALYQVARTALGIPDAMISARIEKQSAELAAKLDVGKLADGAYVAKFIERFAVNWQAAKARDGAAAAAPLLATGGIGSISADTLLAAQTLKGAFRR